MEAHAKYVIVDGMVVDVVTDDHPLRHYKKINEIGRGASGTCFVVEDTRTGELLVMKEIDVSSRCRRRSAMNSDCNLQDRIQKALNEVNLLQKLNHPTIVQYVDSVLVEEDVQESDVSSERQAQSAFLAIVMEYADNGDLSQEIDRRYRNVKSTSHDEFATLNYRHVGYDTAKSHRMRRRIHHDGYFSEDQVLEIFVQCLMAVHYLHCKRIVHRDVKTRNIFLTKSGVTKLGDLGISKELRPSVDLAHTLVGSPFFMSPELHLNMAYSYTCDVWSLGCVLFELCSLRHAFGGKSMSDVRHKVLENNPGRIPVPRFSADLQQLIDDMLQKDPNLRPSTSHLLQRPFVISAVRRLCAARDPLRHPEYTHLHTLEAALTNGSVDYCDACGDIHPKGACLETASTQPSFSRAVAGAHREPDVHRVQRPARDDADREPDVYFCRLCAGFFSDPNHHEHHDHSGRKGLCHTARSQSGTCRTMKVRMHASMVRMSDM